MKCCRSIVVIVCCLIFQACHKTIDFQGIDKGLENREVHFRNNLKDLHLSNLADTVLLVQLDSREVIGEISELIYSDDFIIILDNKKTNKVFVFNWDGYLVGSVSSTGLGPGEFIFPRAITFSNKGNGFLLYSDKTKRIMEYDFSGKFLEEYDVRDLGQISDIIQLDEGYGLALKPDSFEGDQILFVDNEFNLEKKLLLNNFYKNPPFVEGIKTNFFYPKKAGTGFYYKDLLSDFLVEIVDKEVKSKIQFNLPDGAEVDVNQTPRSVRDFLEVSKQEGKIYLGENHVDMGDYMILGMVNSGNSTLALWDKSKNQALFVNKIINDVSTLININGIWGDYCNGSGMLLTAIEAPMLMQLIESVEISNSFYKQKFSKLKISSDDNPVLIIYPFKSELNLE